MLKGKVKRYYTLEQILQTSSEYDILRRYIGHDFNWGKHIESPFRRDDNPSFTITNSGGFTYFKDWADDGVEGNIVEFLKRVFPGKDYGDILSQVAEDMGTRFMEHSIKRGVKEPPKRELAVIQVTKRRFDTADLEYWKSYYQTSRDLEENDVYAVKSYRVNGNMQYLPVTEMCFGYLFQHNGDYFWKIYRPFAADKKDKWRYSGPNDHIHGLGNIKGSGKAIITKSLKDYMVMRKLMNRVASTQSEAKECFNNATLNYLNSTVGDPKDIFVNFDSDEPGVKASRNVSEAYGFNHVNVPKEWAPIKDFADLAKVHGLKCVENYLKHKNII